MFDIKKEIGEIIKSVDFIVLPSFGAFKIDYSKPYLDNDNNIVESLKTYSFTAYLIRDIDEKLFNILNKRTGLSIDLIKQEYEVFLNNYKIEIEKEKKYNWINVGTFYQNKSNEIEFYLEKSIAIETVKQPVVAQFFNDKEEKQNVIITNESLIIVPKSVSKIEQTKPIIKQKPESIVADLPIVLEVNQPKPLIIEETVVEPTNSFKDSIIVTESKNIEEIEEFNDKAPLNYTRIGLFALPILFLLLGLIYTIFIQKDKKKAIKNSSFVVIDSTDIKEAQNFTDSVNNIDLTRIRTQQNLKPRKTDLKDAEPEIKTKRYFITIGSFRDKENADNLVANLTNNGVPVRARREGKIYKVYLRAKDEAQAQEYANKIEQLTGEKPVFE